jgi:phytoene dehydrogenase-like protein
MSGAQFSRMDAIVIGAGPAGFVAAAYLAKAGKRVALLEAQAAPAEPIGALEALDPQVMFELGLIKHGLQFLQRDLPLVALGETVLTLERDDHAAARAIAAVSDADAKVWPLVRRQLFGEARRMRRFWWSGLKEGTPHWVLENSAAKEKFDRLCVTGVDAWLAARFQSDALVAALLWDGVAGGLAPSEPGAALTLLWRAAGEMAGLQNASALAMPGALMSSLAAAAEGAELRAYACVTEILSARGAVEGVRLENGETLLAPLVLSSLSKNVTDILLGLPPAAGPSVGELRLLLSLAEPVTLAPARYRIAEGAESFISAHEEARAGRVPEELPVEFMPVDARHLAVTLRPFPVQPPAGWRTQAAAQAVLAMNRHVPGLARNIANVEFRLSPRRAELARLLMPAGARIQTGMTGLYLCGDDAEPVPALSGRAARIAASFALKSAG